MRQGLSQQRQMIEGFMSEQVRYSAWMVDRLMEQMGMRYKRFDGRIIPVMHLKFERRRVRQRTDSADRLMGLCWQILYYKLTNEDRMETLEALGSICNSIKVDRNNADVIPCRSSFARCLIEVNSKADLVDVVTIGIPSLFEDDFTKETIRVDHPIVATSNVVTPNAEKTNDGFQTVGITKKRKCKSKSTNGGRYTGPSIKHNVRYEPKATTSAPKKGTTYLGYTSQSTPMLKTTGNSSKKDNISMSNSFSALNEEEEEDEEDVENVYDESANLIQNTKAGGSSSFTAAAG
ncbi:hypothetical protein Tco_1379230 [Tanacetum coccineum]